MTCRKSRQKCIFTEIQFTLVDTELSTVNIFDGFDNSAVNLMKNFQLKFKPSTITLYYYSYIPQSKGARTGVSLVSDR